MLGAQLLGAASYQAHSVVLGTTLGANALGTYSRAYQLIHLPINQLQSPATRVALPVLARLQHDPDRFFAVIRRGQTCLLHVTAFVVAVPASLAPWALPLVLGEQWAGVSTPLRILALAGVANMGAYVCYWIYLARGLTGSYFRFSLWARPFVVVAVVLGGFAGTLGVACAFAIASLALWPLNYWWLKRSCELEVWSLFRNAVRVVSYHAVVGVGVGAALAGTDLSATATVGCGLLAIATGYAISVLLSARLREDLVQLRALAVRQRRVGR